MRTFVVGDIHGHARKVRKLLALLHERADPGDALVFVGDYVDRGPDSRSAIALVLEQVTGRWKGTVTALKGNHEEMMLDFMSKRPRFPWDVWLQNGGRETIASYAGSPTARRWEDQIPPAHLEFLRGLKSWHEDENGIYVHAGLLPGVPPAELPEEVLLWIRDEFIDSDYSWGKVVVFGHTPQYTEPQGPVFDVAQLPWGPLVRPEKIGIDTGAAYGGPLTAVILPEREFVSVRE